MSVAGGSSTYGGVGRIRSANGCPPTTDVESTCDGLPKLSQVIDNLGIGWAQARHGFLGGMVWFADGAELLLISTVSNVLSKDWDLTGFERGFLVSIVFVGVMMGNLFSGTVGDTFGRRTPIVCSYAGIFVFSIASSFSFSFWSLAFARFMVGLAFGSGQPAYNAFCSEATPSKHRLMVSGAVGQLFSLGEMYSAFIIYCQDPFMINLDWRLLLQVGSLPAALMCISAYMLLTESPMYLSIKGEHSEAKKVLEVMRSDNGKHDVSIEFSAPKVLQDRSLDDGLSRQLSIILSSHLFLSTAICIYSCFVLNFLFYGCLYAFPHVIGQVKMPGTPAMGLVYGATMELLGTCVGITVGMKIKRKSAQKWYLAGAVLSLLAFAGASPMVGSGVTTLVLYAGYFGIKFFTSIGFTIVYQYSVEIYPTEARVTGTAVVIAGGRLASILAPVVYEAITSIAGGLFEPFFYLVAALCAVNFLFIDLLPYETAGVELQDRLELLDQPTLKERIADGVASVVSLGTKKPPSKV